MTGGKKSAGGTSGGFLNVGGRAGGRFFPVRAIVGIFDLDSATVAETTRQYLKEAERRCRVITVSNALPKSFLLLDDGQSEKIILSPLTPRALLSRSGGEK